MHGTTSHKPKGHAEGQKWIGDKPIHHLLSDCRMPRRAVAHRVRTHDRLNNKHDTEYHAKKIAEGEVSGGSTNPWLQ
jgi:hypothetical protein